VFLPRNKKICTGILTGSVSAKNSANDLYRPLSGMNGWLRMSKIILLALTGHFYRHQVCIALDDNT
jgi:hypothetical protein